MRIITDVKLPSLAATHGGQSNNDLGEGEITERNDIITTWGAIDTRMRC